MKGLVKKLAANKSTLALVSVFVGIILIAGGQPTGIIFVVAAGMII